MRAGYTRVSSCEHSEQTSLTRSECESRKFTPRMWTILERSCDNHTRLVPFHSPTTSTMSNNKLEGRREDALAKQRMQMREEYERQKEKLISETEKARPSTNRFVGQHDSVEDSLKNSTVGLVRLEEFQQRRKEIEEARAREAARTNELK